MPTEDENRWARINDLFSAALALPKDARIAFLQRERFRQERQILARLAHPNIARVLYGGHR